MKNILTFLIISLMVLPVAGQVTNPEKATNAEIRTALDSFRKLTNRMLDLVLKNESESLTAKAGLIEKLDSSVREHHESGWKRIKYYRYDAQGRIIEKSSVVPISGGHWELTTYSYDSEDRIIEEKGMNWTGSDTPNFQHKTTFSYAGTKLIEEMFYSRMPADTQLKLTNKRTYHYNSTGEKIEEVRYFWDSGSGLWVLQNKTTYSYNSTGELIEETRYTRNWMANNWDPEYKTLNTYYGNSVETRGMNWNNNKQQWDSLRYKNIYFYDNGLLIADHYYNQDDFTNEWKYHWKTLYEYESGQISQSREYRWNEKFSDWILNSKTQVTYDANGNFTELQMGSWLSNKWSAFKLIAVYDRDIDLSDVSFPPDAFEWGLNVNNKLLSLHYSVFENGSWTESEKTSYHYSNYTGTGISSKVRSNINIYPNPAKDHITFDLPESTDKTKVIIMDMNGKVVLLQNLNAQNNQVKVNELSKGIYLYKLIGAEVNTGKFVVE